MMLGLRDYVNKNRFPGVVLGLSGGIDSALSAAVAVDALGAGPRALRDAAVALYQPRQPGGCGGLRPAARHAPTTPSTIEPAMAAFGETLAPPFAGRAPDTTEENIQSRARGVILMALSNKFGPMVLTTGNKSEMRVGYATLYGDMCGGYNVLKDVYKTEVFRAVALAQPASPAGRARARRAASSPSASSPSRPRAELQAQPDRPGHAAALRHAGRHSGMPGRARDAVRRRSWRSGYDPRRCARSGSMLYLSEYKRRQAPPGVKITRRTFGRDRRYPITNAFRDAR